MFSLLLAALVPTLATPAAKPQAPAAIEFSTEVRWALISGLGRQLKGRYILNNVAHADGSCELQVNCVTAERLRRSGDPAIRSARTIPELADAVRIGGERPVAVVSVISVGFNQYGPYRALLVIQDTRTGKGIHRIAEFAPGSYVGHGVGVWSKIDKLEPL